MRKIFDKKQKSLYNSIAKVKKYVIKKEINNETDVSA